MPIFVKRRYAWFCKFHEEAVQRSMMKWHAEMGRLADDGQMGAGKDEEQSGS